MDCDLETRLANSNAILDQIRSKHEELRKKLTPPPMESNSNKHLKETYLTYLDYWLQELQNQQVILNEAKDRLQHGTSKKSGEEIPTIKLSQIDVLMKELEEVKSENEELKSKVNELANENTILHSACDTLNEQVTKLDEKCTNLDTAYNALNEQVTNLVEDNQNLHRVIDNVNARYEEIIRRLPSV